LFLRASLVVAALRHESSLRRLVTMSNAMSSLAPARATRSRFLGLVLLAMFVVACSRDSGTGPTDVQRERFAQQLDSARLASNDQFRAGVLENMLQVLALGGQIDTVVISVNGIARRHPTLAATFVQTVTGRPIDSTYVIYAWQGDALDTIFEFARHEVPGSAAHLGILSGDIDLFAADAAVTGQFSSSAASGSCTNLRTHIPSDVNLPAGIACQRQTISASVSALVQLTHGSTTVTLPQQSVKAAHLVFNSE
jgi:hypothetical protein